MVEVSDDFHVSIEVLVLDVSVAVLVFVGLARLGAYLTSGGADPVSGFVIDSCPPLLGLLGFVLTLALFILLLVKRGSGSE